MTLNVRDAENSWLEGKRDWQKFLAEFNMQWYAPQMLEDIVQLLQSAPPEALDALPPDVRDRLLNIKEGRL